MQINLTPVSADSTDPTAFECDVLIAGVTADSELAKSIGDKAGVDLMAVAAEEGFKAEKGQTKLFRGLTGLGTTRVLLVGLGSDDDIVAGSVRTSLVKAAKTAGSIKAKRVGIALETSDHVQQAVEGFQFGAYRFDKYVHRDEDSFEGHESVTVLGDVSGGAIARAEAFASGVYQARNLCNEAPNVLFPAHMAEIAVDIATQVGLEHTIYDDDYLVSEGFNLLMAVGKGSEHKPRLIHLTYRPEGEVKKKICLVGKGITFDTGGYNLKPSGSILGMHIDMGGAAAVLGAARAIGMLAPEGVEVHFIVPTAENSVSSTAYRPNDIIRGLGGKTVEIHNTDAEGRLILADALTYAQRLKPDEMIDLATLTGACVVALGEHTAGLFSNDESMVEGIMAASKTVSEDFWRLPLNSKLDSLLDTPMADMKNVGPRWGGAITAALFLKRWVDMDAWAHLDIAGPAMADKDTDLGSQGGTGFAAATLTAYVLSKQ
jgi:leucyl aminopeptidase